MSRRVLAAGLTGLALVAIIAVVLVISGGSDSGDSTASGETAGQVQTPGGQQVPTDLVTCLEQQGVELPSGPPGSGQMPSAGQMQAMQACAEYMPQGVGPPGGMPLPGN